MNKVLVSIYVLKLDQEFEVFLPPNKKIVDIICMISKSLHEISNDVFPMNFQNLLYDTEQNLFYDVNLSVKDVGLKNGKRLIFF